MVISVDALVQKRRRSRSLFDDFFSDPFGRTVKKTLSSQTVTLNVKPLPSSGRPADFEGAVGEYQMSVESDKTVLKANEAVSFKLAIQGSGNIKLINLPDLNIPPDVEAYDPKETTSIERENNKISGKKVVEYVLIPRFKGDYRIDPVSFSFYNPERKRYIQLQSKEINLKILEGDATSAGLISGASLSKQEVALLGEDIRYIKETTEFFQVGQKLYENWLYLLSYLIPVIGFVFAWRYRIYRAQLKGNLEFARRRQAGKIAAKQLTRARQELKANNREEFYRSTTQALQGFVCDRLNLQITDFSLPSAAQVLQGAGLGANEIDEYLSCLQQSDFQRYSGSTDVGGEMNAFYDRVKNILTRLEKYI